MHRTCLVPLFSCYVVGPKLSHVGLVCGYDELDQMEASSVALYDDEVAAHGQVQ